MSNELIYKGKTYGYNDDGERADKLISVSAYIGDSLPAAELSVDTLTAVVTDHDTEPRVLVKDGVPVVDASGTLMVAPRTGVTMDKTAKYGDEVVYKHNGKQVGKFRVEQVKRIGKATFQLSCVSDVGLLITDKHYGGIYNGQTVAEVVDAIIGGKVPYTLDPSLGAVAVYGLLRIRSRRDNLRDLLFAVGGQIRKDEAGQIVIGPMPEAAPYEITADEFYMGGSVTGGNPATGIDLTEHNFAALATDAEVCLFDGVASAEELVTPKGNSVTGVLVAFGEPMHDLSIENAEILESDVNYAVISGSPTAVLKGLQYTHSTRIVSRRQVTDGVANVVTSKACELVNVLNSEMVADRLMAYYGTAKTIEADIVMDGQNPGDAVTFIDPFGDPTGGYIANMELTMSAIIKARTTLVSGFIPGGSGNYYRNVIVITESGSITIPAEAKEKGLLVLIGGGDGGAAGSAGAAGAWDAGSGYGSPGAGGQPGTPGNGGKIFVATIQIRPGEVYEAEIGEGGAAAQPGGATIFGGYTSENGRSSETGYSNLLTGEVYGIPGEEGIPGGSGAGRGNNSGGVVTYKGEIYTAGAKGANDSSAYGGYGGGPAAGAHGGAGQDGEMYRVTMGTNAGSDQAQGGNGGVGATPVKADAGAVPGQGGQAGHGGGGGGGGGGASGGDIDPSPGIGGAGGAGGVGGDGAAGIALLFY